MIALDLLIREVAQIGEDATRLGRVTATREEQLHQGEVDEGRGVVLPRLHLAINDALILALTRHVMNFRRKALIGERRVQYVVDVDRQQVEQTLVAADSMV